MFIRLFKNGQPKDYLFALVGSYSHLTGQFHTRGDNEMKYILAHQRESLGGYQTTFSLFYRNKTDEQVPQRHAVYVQDPIFGLLLRNVDEHYDRKPYAPSIFNRNQQILEQKKNDGFLSKLLNIFQ